MDQAEKVSTKSALVNDLFGCEMSANYLEILPNIVAPKHWSGNSWDVWTIPAVSRLTDGWVLVCAVATS
jgi:hypothetical protein